MHRRALRRAAGPRRGQIAHHLSPKAVRSFIFESIQRPMLIFLRRLYEYLEIGIHEQIDLVELRVVHYTPLIVFFILWFIQLPGPNDAMIHQMDALID